MCKHQTRTSKSAPCFGTPIVVYLAKEERGQINTSLFCHEMYGTLVD